MSGRTLCVVCGGGKEADRGNSVVSGDGESCSSFSWSPLLMLPSSSVSISGLKVLMPLFLFADGFLANALNGVGGGFGIFNPSASWLACCLAEAAFAALYSAARARAPSIFPDTWSC